MGHDAQDSLMPWVNVFQSSIDIPALRSFVDTQISDRQNVYIRIMHTKT
jgi:hypothetical protein